jgi:hypothetical protein
MTHAQTRGWRGLSAVALALAGCQGRGGAGDGTAGPGGTDTGAATDGAGSESESDTEPHEPEGGYADPRAMGPTGLRRQTHAELRNTLELVLGVDASEVDDLLALLPADSSTPFDNDYGTQEPSQPLIEGMLSLAEKLAKLLAEDPARRDALMGCTPSSASDEACLRQGIERLGRLVLRRPLATEEIDGYAGFIAVAEEEGDFGIAVELVLASLLLDGEFLYRIEVGEPVDGDALVRLTDFELASRLSFLLWGSAPNDELLDVAADGALQSSDDVYDTAVWMLEDPRATAQIQRLHAMWLGYHQLVLEPTLAASLRNETDALVQRYVERGRWLGMFTSRESFLDDTLAQHYDIALPGGEAGWVEYPDVRRGGILSHGSFLAIGKKFADTSPVERGKAVWTRLLCNELAPPPPDVDTGLPPSGASPDACKTERYDMASRTECASCHAILDPIGFGLENYGPAGEWRTVEPDNAECSIEGRGELVGADDFAGPGALGELLVESGQLEGCFMQNFYRFVVGRAPTEDDDVMLDAIVETFENEDDFAALLLTFAASEGFRHRLIEEVD